MILARLCLANIHTQEQQSIYSNLNNIQKVRMSRLEEAIQKFEKAGKFTQSIFQNQDIWDLCEVMGVESELYREAAKILEPGDVVVLKQEKGDAVFLQLKGETFIGFSSSNGFFEESLCYIHSVSKHDPNVKRIIEEMGFVHQRR